jgi:hypothetical protein
MNFDILNNKPLEFYNENGELVGNIFISGSEGDLYIAAVSGTNADVIIGNRSTVGDVEIGLPSSETTFKLMGGGTISGNGKTLTIGDSEAGDTVILNTSSSFITRAQSPFFTINNNPFTASATFAGTYVRSGGNLTCSIFTTSSVHLTPGAEFSFFQTSSADNLLFETASGVTLNSKNGNLNLAGQFSSATLKFIGDDTFDLVGDLT